MFEVIGNIFRLKELRMRIIFTLLLLVVFRIGSFIPVPNTDANQLRIILDQKQGVFSLFNAFSGGAISNFLIFAMGIMPYITSSIIIQLLSMDVIPTFARWAKEGELGRHKLAQVTRYGTILLSIIQSIGLSMGFNKMVPGFVKGSGFTTYALISITLTAGTAFLMWLGEQITDKGIGNGISILIFAGIVSSIPVQTQKVLQSLFLQNSGQTFLKILELIALFLGIVLVIVGVIYVQQGVRKITVQYTKRIVGRKMYSGQATHIPLKLNSAGVIPVIFALSIMLFPQTVASFWPYNKVANWVLKNFSYTQSSLGMTLYSLLIMAFTFFYTYVQINPLQLADQMKKNGAFIPGIRPGKNTSAYLTKIMNRLTLTGSIFLVLVSILPIFFINILGLPQSVQIGGTSLLIVVGVALEMMKNVESQLIRKHYKGFMNS